MSDKNALIQPDRGQKAIAIHLVDKDGLDDFLKVRTPRENGRPALAATACYFLHRLLPI